MSSLRTWSLRSRLTLGILLLSAFGFILSSLVARQALEGYLVGQVDTQLTTLAKTSLPVIASAGIIREEDHENFNIDKKASVVKSNPEREILSHVFQLPPQSQS